MGSIATAARDGGASMAHMLTRRQTLAGLALVGATGGRAFAQADQDPDAWPDLVRMFFNDAAILEDQSLVSFEAPERAEDAALVPMSFSAKLPEGDTRISTRVRVNSYTNARVVAELSDGSLHMATRYIKASGGCSAPMVKTMDEALATLGQMKFRILPPTPAAPNEALLMVRHPNNSGLQMDQVTRLYTPARYIAKLAVYQGQDLVFSMAAGISISEDPNFRFTYKPNGAKMFRVEAEDTAGKTFSGAWPATRGGA